MAQAVDPITFSVVLKALAATTREMTTTLEYTARSPFIALMRDHSCSVFDSVPRMLYQEEALPVHSAGGIRTLQSLLEIFGDDIHDGDVFLSNSPYHGGTHNSDLTALLPVFYRGEHLFWTITRAHQQNVGQGWIGETSLSVWQEGLQITPVKVYDRGRECHDVIRMYMENVRLQDWLRGDLLAMIGSVRVGAERLVELTERYGVDVTRACLDELIAYADRRTGDEIRTIPDGVYEADGWADSDGAGTFNTYVKATVTVADAMVSIDFSGSAPEVLGGINSSLGNMEANAAIGILTAIAPDIPRNDGCLKHIVVTAPKGSVVNARWPASTFSCTVLVGDVLSEVVWKALARAMPGRVSAGWGRMQTPSLAGNDYRGDAPRPFMVTLLTGGSGGGANRDHDGWALTQTTCSMAQMKKESVEMAEFLFPLLIETNEFATDSAGPGKWVGGYGIETRIRPTSGPAWTRAWGDGRANPPFGVLNGRPGVGGGACIEDRDTRKRRFFVHKPPYEMLLPNEVLHHVSTGGGGFGHPHERDPELVRQAVLDGLVSFESARDDFGVEIDRETGEIDRDATETRRERMRREQPDAAYGPIAADAGVWVRANRRPTDDLVDEPGIDLVEERISVAFE